MRNISPLFSRQSPLSLAKRLKALAAAAHAKTIKEIAAFIDWRPFPATVPRSNCRHLTIPLRGIPKRLHASTIRLQLLNLTGLPAIGFAWKLSGDEAEVWHWNEEKFRNTVDFPLTESLINGIQPQPEMLLRSTTLPDGLHLLACRNGYEALSIVGTRLIKTRWFPRPPDDTAWQGFVRDAGRIPEENPRPAPTSPSLGNKLAQRVVDGQSVEHRAARGVHEDREFLGVDLLEVGDERSSGDAPEADLVVDRDFGSGVAGFCLDGIPRLLHGGGF